MRIFLLVSVIFFGKLLADAFPIDVVYTWVNGQDESWQKLRDEWLVRENPRMPSASAARRFRDRDELRYSLRSIRAFAPFVRHIYIVTCGQRPSWIVPHPMITFIDHKDIFLNQKDLPTFNSMAIEANLHRIPGLSEHYIYFNDDVFLLKKTTESTFFTKEGKMRVFLSQHELPNGDVLATDSSFIAACKNADRLLTEEYGMMKRYMHAHTPFPSVRQVSTYVERLYSDIFAATSSHRFRSQASVTITNGLIPYVALYDSLAETSSYSSHTWSFGESDEKDKRVFSKLQKEPTQFLCIQDALGDDGDAVKADKRLKKYLNTFFPKPAPWEKPS